MTKAELESKHLAELHTLAAKQGVSRYRMLPRAELIDALAGGEAPAKAPERTPAPKPPAPKPPPRATTPRADEAPARPRRRRRRRFGRRRGKGGPREYANRLLEAWNAHDLDAVVACYAENVDFAIPAAAEGREDRRLRGREELREHFARGLELAPNLALTEESLLVGPGGFALLYRREDGHRAIEAVELDGSGLVARARVYYEREQI
jgi:hypothetical protein